jgi:NAD(P)-dependent dehydrogenase (short-subunit alcohol dehydrogenase family)
VARLAGKVAIVTGGGRGIGREAATAFAREGACVVIADAGLALDGTGGDAGPAEQAAAAIRAAGGDAHAAVADVGDAGQAGALVRDTVGRHGRLDILVNAAGILRQGTILEQTDEDWALTLRVHLTGTFNTSRAAAAHWSEARAGGRLITVGSDAGLYGVQDSVAYAAAKAGIVAFTLSCAETLRPFGATANVFIPQAATRMTRSIPLEQLPEPERWATGEFEAANVPPALVYLASDEAGWITGRVVAGFGYEVHLYSLPVRMRSIYSPGPWDLDVLFDRFRQAFEPVTATA